MFNGNVNISASQSVFSVNVTAVTPVLGNTCESSAFFNNYYSKYRFALETVLCALAATTNILTIIFIKVSRQETTPSRVLFLNLAVTNMLSAVLFWLCNNVMYLFRRQLMSLMTSEPSKMCTISLLLMGAAFLSSLVILISAFTLLGFAVVQYIAICRPLQSLQVVTLTKVKVYLVATWTLTGIASYLPFFILLVQTARMECTAEFQQVIEKVTLTAANISACCMGLVFCIIVGICLRVYSEIRLLRKRLERFHRLQDTISDRKAFTTTLIFVLTLTLFYVPYELLYILSLNIDLGCEIKGTAVVFYMNFLPYLKFVTDPVVYGLRMRDVTLRCRRMLSKCGRHNAGNEIPTRTTTHYPLSIYG